MRRLAAACVLLLALVACGRDEPKLVEPKTTPTTASDASLATTPTSTAQTTTSLLAGSGLVPPDSQTPAAGTCATAAGGSTDITLSPDVPSPRCTIVHETDHLRITNADTHAPLYGGSGPEVWLQS